MMPVDGTLQMDIFLGLGVVVLLLGVVAIFSGKAAALAYFAEMLACSLLAIISFKSMSAELLVDPAGDFQRTPVATAVLWIAEGGITVASAVAAISFLALMIAAVFSRREDRNPDSDLR